MAEREASLSHSIWNSQRGKKGCELFSDDRVWGSGFHGDQFLSFYFFFSLVQQLNTATIKEKKNP